MMTTEASSTAKQKIHIVKSVLIKIEVEGHERDMKLLLGKIDLLHYSSLERLIQLNHVFARVETSHSAKSNM